MSDPKESIKFSLKVLLNKQKTKVLYAEADNEFTDVLLSFLTLPLGTIVRILGQHYGDKAPVIGSLTTLYNGLLNLDSDLFCTESCKKMLMNPRKSIGNERCILKLDVDDTQPRKYFQCADKDCRINDTINNLFIGIYYDTLKCPKCKKSALSKEIDVSCYNTVGVYTESNGFFFITDDLKVFPRLTGYAIRILSNQCISNMDGTELRNVTFGFNEIMELLKRALLSKTPLTDIILNERHEVDSVIVKCETGILLSHQIVKQTTSNTKKIPLIAIFQISTDKLLFVEAGNDFIEFLFTFLVIPLGGVECLLDRNTPDLKNIQNLYTSVSDINDKYLNSKCKKDMLIKPGLPLFYTSYNQILPLTDEERPHLYFNHESLGKVHSSDVIIRSPRETYEKYVKGPKMFLVTDDLTVAPSCTAPDLSILNKLKIPMSDVREMEMLVGVEEALSILKASLTSNCALTNGFINQYLKKQAMEMKSDSDFLT